MLRTLLLASALLGLLGACSSAPNTTELGVDASIPTQSVAPHAPGLGGLGEGVEKYWLGRDVHSPYAQANSQRGFFSLFYRSNSFGQATQSDWRGGGPLYLPKANQGMQLGDWFFNQDSKSPYQ